MHVLKSRKTRKTLIAGLLAMSVTPLFASSDYHVAPWDYEYLSVNEAEYAQTQANVAVLDQIFNALFAQDWEQIKVLYADNYVQHNPDMNDGKEGVIELFSSLDYEKMIYKPVLRIAEGPYVAVLSEFQAVPEAAKMAVVDINFIREGKSREHWDMLMPTSGQPNAAGRTLFEVAFQDQISVDRQTQNQNKTLVAEMINTLFNRKEFDKIDQYIGDTYIQHGEGDDGRESMLADMQARFKQVEVDIKRIIAENDLVLAHSKVSINTKDFARTDIWRVRDKKMVEHWGVMQPVPAQMQHVNGMF